MEPWPEVEMTSEAIIAGAVRPPTVIISRIKHIIYH